MSFFDSIKKLGDSVSWREPFAKATGKQIITKSHIFILDPVHGDAIKPNATIRLEFLSAVPSRAKGYLFVKSAEGQSKFRIPISEAFELPSEIQAGRQSLRVVVLHGYTKWVSQIIDVTVDPSAISPTETGLRIQCAAPWLQMNVGKANASPCCNFRRKFRNPFRDDAEGYDPWNSKTMQAVREALVQGDSKYCYAGCAALRHSSIEGLNRLRAADANPAAIESYLRGDIRLENGPSRLKITVNHFCNHACLFCSRDIRSSWKANDAIFDLLCKHIADVKKIALTGGEPLVFIDEVSDRLYQLVGPLTGKTLEITTNGSLIAQCIDFLTEVDDLVMNISLNAGTRESYRIVHRKDHFDKVIAGIKLLKKQRASKKLFIRLKMVIMHQNRFDIPAYVDLAKLLAVDKVKFTTALLYEKADMTVDDQLRAGSSEWKQTEQELVAAVQELQACGIACTYSGPGWKRDDPDPLELEEMD